MSARPTPQTSTSTSTSTNYHQGYSSHTISTHLQRTAQTDAAFLLPHIKPTSHILDVGCGPGTITTSLASLAPQGATLGIDIGGPVVAKAASLAAAAGLSASGPGSVRFEVGDVLGRLPCDDESFDVVYCGQLFGHIPLPDLPLQALAEIRRVLKTGGVLATRDGVVQHFYPQSSQLDRLWVGNMNRAIASKRAKAEGGDVGIDIDMSDEQETTGSSMLSLLRKSGFAVDAGKVHFGTSGTVHSTLEARRWLAKRAAGQLSVENGDEFRKNWLKAGISEEEIEQTVRAAREWAETEDAWYVSLACEMLAWK